MMSAIEAAGTSGYQPAQLLNWVYMSLRDAQGGAFEGLRAEPDASTRDVNVISKRGAADLSSNYLNNFFHLRGEVVSDKQSGLINSLNFVAACCYYYYHHHYCFVPVWVLSLCTLASSHRPTTGNSGELRTLNEA